MSEFSAFPFIGVAIGLLFLGFGTAAISVSAVLGISLEGVPNNQKAKELLQPFLIGFTAAVIGSCIVSTSLYYMLKPILLLIRH